MLKGRAGLLHGGLVMKGSQTQKTQCTWQDTVESHFLDPLSELGTIRNYDYEIEIKDKEFAIILVPACLCWEHCGGLSYLSSCFNYLIKFN